MASSTPPLVQLTTSLPQDIVEFVIDLVHADRGTLAAASLVDKTWRASSRPRLFRQIVVDLTRIHSTAVLELMDLLPTIYQHVQELRFVGYTAENAEQAEPDLLLLAHIGLVMRHVPSGQITRLSLKGCVFLHDYSDSLALAPSDELKSFFASIQSLRVHGAAFFRSRLLEWYISTACTQLQSLILGDLNIYGSVGMGMATWLTTTQSLQRIEQLELVVVKIFVLRSLTNSLRVQGRTITIRRLILRFDMQLNAFPTDPPVPTVECPSTTELCIVTRPDGVLLQHITDWMLTSLSLPNVTTLRFFLVDRAASASAPSEAVRLHARRLYELRHTGWSHVPHINVYVLPAVHAELTDGQMVHPLLVLDENRRVRLPFNRA